MKYIMHLSFNRKFILYYFVEDIFRYVLQYLIKSRDQIKKACLKTRFRIILYIGNNGAPFEYILL